jgi:NADH:ubiquinone oxidoreductase subunit 6 (subunit J)
MWVLHRVSLVGVAVAGVLVAAWMLQGRAHFGDLFGIGLVYAGAIGMICAFCYGGTEPTLCDPMNARNHWRGHLQTAAVVMVVAAVGGVVSALT